MDEVGEGQACNRCGMAALVLHNGLLVCEACGTQAEVSLRLDWALYLITPFRYEPLQDFVEETAEFQVGVDDTARRRTLKMNRRKDIVQGEAEPVPVREAVNCYCKCMQVMLQASYDLPSAYWQKHAVLR